MDLRNAFKSFVNGDEDRAVSPVIGVILMVAITVILAAVIGTFVLGLGDRVNSASPTATFSFDYTTAGNTDKIVSITHDGGDSVQDSQIKVQVGSTTTYENDNFPSPYNGPDSSDGWNGDITAGDTLEIDGDGNFANGDKVKVIWTAPGSDKTAVIGESEVEA